MATDTRSGAEGSGPWKGTEGFVALPNRRLQRRLRQPASRRRGSHHRPSHSGSIRQAYRKALRMHTPASRHRLHHQHAWHAHTHAENSA